MPSREPIDGQVNVALPDEFEARGGPATFPLPGLLDKLDVVVLTSDALIQFRDVQSGSWTPEGGMPLRAGLAQSITGIGDVYDHLGGVDQFRLAERVAGGGAIADVRWFLL